MHLTFRGVNEAFTGLVTAVHKGILHSHVQASRYGEVAMVEEPVTVTYLRPVERVLFNPSRDANPFFHLYEALWMLAGRNDVNPVAYYCSRMREFSDDGSTLNGAYGERWREATAHTRDFAVYFDERDGGGVTGPGKQVARVERRIVDQLDVVIHHLTRLPNSRRAVLQMWNVEDDLLHLEDSVDVCCNLSAVFMTEQGICPACQGKQSTDIGVICRRCNGRPHEQPQFLNMTVFNRSNDMIWGLLGANAVHFSFLLEYVALALGLEVGKYHQITSNLHVYTNNWDPTTWLKDTDQKHRTMHSPPKIEYGKLTLVPLYTNREIFDKEVREFVQRHSKDAFAGVYSTPFLDDVAQPMCIAWHHWKQRRHEAALSSASHIQADDWRLAATDWLRRHIGAREQPRPVVPDGGHTAPSAHEELPQPTAQPTPQDIHPNTAYFLDPDGEDED